MQEPACASRSGARTESRSCWPRSPVFRSRSSRRTVERCHPRTCKRARSSDPSAPPSSIPGGATRLIRGLADAGRDVAGSDPPRIPRQPLVRRAHDALRLPLDPRPIGAKLPRLAIVFEIRAQQRSQPLVPRRALDGGDGFHATIEVARHPVSRSKIEFLGAVVREIPETRMLEKSPDDADHANPVAHAGEPGTQAADAAHDEIDL